MSYLEKAKKAEPQAPVLTIVGFPGVGKSTIAALFPAPIFIQAENASTVLRHGQRISSRSFSQNSSAQP